MACNSLPSPCLWERYPRAQEDSGRARPCEPGRRARSPGQQKPWREAGAWVHPRTFLWGVRVEGWGGLDITDNLQGSFCFMKKLKRCFIMFSMYTPPQPQDKVSKNRNVRIHSTCLY